MNILEQNKEKINGILETFDRMLILKVKVILLKPVAFTLRTSIAFTLRIKQNINKQ